jgi:hypothetical protein
MDNQAMATKAIETTIRLKRRIRFSYSCAQLSCCSIADVRFAAQTNPLVFHVPFLLNRKEEIAATKLL